MLSDRIVIIADDLTGALDASAPLAGIPGGVAVATRPEALTEALRTDAGVIAVSTRSREVAADRARQTVADVLQTLPTGIRIIKKVDSRLKGNLVAELSAFGDCTFHVLPSIPEFGRVVQNGDLTGFGVDRPIRVLDRLGDIAPRCLVPDTPDQTAMKNAVAATPGDVVLVGARGMTQALAGQLGLTPLASPRPLPGPTCILVGSTDPITLRQIAELRRAAPYLTYVSAPSGEVPALDPSGAEVTLIQMTKGPEREQDAAAKRFAETALPHLAAARSLVLTGGATAEGALDALGLCCLRIQGEPLPGLVQCGARGKTIVTKSGGFGSADALIQLTLHPQRTEA